MQQLTKSNRDKLAQLDNIDFGSAIKGVGSNLQKLNRWIAYYPHNITIDDTFEDRDKIQQLLRVYNANVSITSKSGEIHDTFYSR